LCGHMRHIASSCAMKKMRSRGYWYVSITLDPIPVLTPTRIALAIQAKHAAGLCHRHPFFNPAVQLHQRSQGPLQDHWPRRGPSAGLEGVCPQSLVLYFTSDITVFRTIDKFPTFAQAEHLYYPLDICRRLAALLRETNATYPPNRQTMSGLDAGWLYRA
jgi:hypothetical protein